MLFLVLAYLGGVLTILSPCILPVLPFVFARADRPFWRNGLPLLAGLVLTFVAVASLAGLAGQWAVAVNQFGRDAALALLALFGLALVWPRAGTVLTGPLVALGNRLALRNQDGIIASLVLGIATGFLWAPCAGPILGLILTGSALSGAPVGPLLAFGAGAASSLAVALFAGGRVFALMKRSQGAGEHVRRILGGVVLAGVGAIALGLDTDILTRLPSNGAAAIEQRLIDGFAPAPAMAAPAMTAPANVTIPALADEGALPALTGATRWLNSPPLTPEALKGKVVLIDFWTYSCINCLRSLPYVKAWAETYQGRGLVVIGVHSPEFAFEKDEANVAKAIADLHVTYPVAMDNDYAIWGAFANRYWPAHYLIDAKGRVRYHHFGEGDYAETEQAIRQLLAEAGQTTASVPSPAVTATIEGMGAEGVGAAADFADVKSPETYIGSARAMNFIATRTTGDAMAADNAADYAVGEPKLNQWGLAGAWTIEPAFATLNKPGGRIVFRFHARDLHLVLAPTTAPVRFKVTIDGAEPGRDHGMDVDEKGWGLVSADRLYQLIRQTGPITDHTFAIEFLDPGVQAYAFTFG